MRHEYGDHSIDRWTLSKVKPIGKIHPNRYRLPLIRHLEVCPGTVFPTGAPIWHAGTTWPAVDALLSMYRLSQMLSGCARCHSYQLRLQIDQKALRQLHFGFTLLLRRMRLPVCCGSQQAQCLFLRLHPVRAPSETLDRNED